MSAGDILLGAVLGIGCYMFGKHEDMIFKVIADAKNKLLKAKTPEEKKKVVRELKEDPTLQELFRLMKEEDEVIDEKNKTTTGTTNQVAEAAF